jgi:hypothetical protein
MAENRFYASPVLMKFTIRDFEPPGNPFFPLSRKKAVGIRFRIVGYAAPFPQTIDS